MQTESPYFHDKEDELKKVLNIVKSKYTNLLLTEGHKVIVRFVLPSVPAVPPASKNTSPPLTLTVPLALISMF